MSLAKEHMRRKYASDDEEGDITDSVAADWSELLGRWPDGACCRGSHVPPIDIHLARMLVRTALHEAGVEDPSFPDCVSARLILNVEEALLRDERAYFRRIYENEAIALGAGAFSSYDAVILRARCILDALLKERIDCYPLDRA